MTERSGEMHNGLMSLGDVVGEKGMIRFVRDRALRQLMLVLYMHTWCELAYIKVAA